ncbi:bacteriocin [Staphylococcus auricularis]|nr:bacteriocin [Staphylococcus auricularis]
MSMKQLNTKELKAVNGGATGPQWVGRVTGKVAGGIRSFASGFKEAVSE